MTLRGHIKGGTVVLDEPTNLPDGTAVEVRAVEHAPPSDPPEAGPTLYERLADVIGIAEGLPEDMAENHDQYIHGTPKRTAR
jgi:hypothetical protein